MFISIDSTLLDITKKNDSGIDDSQNSIYQFTNKKGQTIYIEAVALGADETGNVSPTLNVRDEDVRALRRHLDSDRDGKLEKRELAATKITEAQNVQLIIDSTLLDISIKNDSDIDDNQKNIYQITNKKGQAIYIEAAALGADEAGNVLPTLNVEDEDVRALRRHLDSDRDGKLEKRELAATKITEAQNVQLIDNHAFRSQVSRKFEASGVRFQWASPKNFLGMSKGGTLDFADDIVSVGTDEKGEIITFICPEVTKTSKLPFGLSTSFTGEVEIGMVAGSIDTITGAGTIYLDDVNWLFWGSVESNTELGIKKYGIAERDAARVPVWSNRGRGALIVLDNVTAGAYAGQDAGKIFSSFVVKAQQGVTPKQPLAQQLLISAINDLVFPGLLSQGTSLQWNIDLKQGIPVDGLA